jgi:regulator of protease activity HflC (stomatin/prohibitin superfamily)
MQAAMEAQAAAERQRRATVTRADGQSEISSEIAALSFALI